MNPRREYGVTIAVLVLAAIAMVIAYGATWITATVPVFRGEVTPTRLVSFTGSALLGGAAAAGWVAAAAAAGIVATRTWGRTAIGVVAALAGAVGGTQAVTFILSRGALVSQALDGDDALEISGNAWWLVAALSGLAIMVSGAVTALRGRGWPSLSSRYERASPRARALPADGGGSSVHSVDGASAITMWDALDRGEDPTQGASNGSAEEPPDGAGEDRR